MHEHAREHFDRILEDAIDSLPPQFQGMLQEVSIVALDHPTPEMIDVLRREGTIGPDDRGDDLCGLHTGTARTERSIDIEGGRLPDQIHIFREGITALALSTDDQDGDWRVWERAVLAGQSGDLDDDVYEEARITLLHEIGHHFGLDESDLDDLGYA
ncbi:MAG: metallopeptidase family protein [Phycisphaeraceae bacterium]|nr:metallopeptidase family protein [Phycisphaeraceae bacterium]